jgi:sulfite reductase (NADPH) flavoprotein alpha-component
VASVPLQKVTVPLDRNHLSVLDSAVAEYDREQLLWSSGYLAGMAAFGVAERLPVATQPTAMAGTSVWSIFYATETGNSRRIAVALAERSRESGLAVELHDLREYRPKALSKIENALFVIATHGIGEAPDGSELFFEYWFSKKAPSLQNLNYSILALGDSSYADFCEMGKRLDTRLQELGAKAVVERVDCDLDFDASAANWTDQVVSHAVAESDTAALNSAPYLRPVSKVALFTRERPFDAEILTRQRITGHGSSKDVRHIEISLEGSGLSYLPGDSLGVVPQNPPELVEALLESLDLDGTEEVAVEGKSIALSDALTRHKEITGLNRPFLEGVASEHQKLHEIVNNRDKISELFKTWQVIDIVTRYPKSWQAQTFVDSLRKLTPRLYSIASSLDANPDEAHLTVGVVRYTQFGRPHWGSASSYLTSGAEEVPVYIEQNDHFRLPADGDTPIIMVGAGTGVAPYRAFVEHRKENGHNGDNWLIFGERNFSSDFLYQLEWLRYRKAGLLNRIDVAFSRDQSEKVYVQHQILQQAKQVHAWLERGAHIYVCGDAERMAADVNQALLSVLQSEGGLSGERSAQYLSELKSAHRYQRDVY